MKKLFVIALMLAFGSVYAQEVDVEGELEYHLNRLDNQRVKIKGLDSSLAKLEARLERIERENPGNKAKDMEGRTYCMYGLEQAFDSSGYRQSAFKGELTFTSSTQASFVELSFETGEIDFNGHDVNAQSEAVHSPETISYSLSGTTLMLDDGAFVLTDDGNMITGVWGDPDGSYYESQIVVGALGNGC